MTFAFWHHRRSRRSQVHAKNGLCLPARASSWPAALAPSSLCLGHPRTVLAGRDSLVVGSRSAMDCARPRAPDGRLRCKLCHLSSCTLVPRPSATMTVRCMLSSGVAVVAVELWLGRVGCAVCLHAAIVTLVQSEKRVLFGHICGAICDRLAYVMSSSPACAQVCFRKLLGCSFRKYMGLGG